MRARAIATSSIRRRAGSSAACGSPTTPTDTPERLIMTIKTNTARARPLADNGFASDVLSGLSGPQKWLAPKYFYDERGSQLFEAITELKEYYPTRCELAILREHKADIARVFGPKTALIEFGTGSTRNVRILFDAATTVQDYVPVDISDETLLQ